SVHAGGVEGSGWGQVLQQELATLTGSRGDFVRHDLLGDVNQPFYFHEFIKLAARPKLQYLSGPILAQMLRSNVPPRIQETLRRVGNDPIILEQYLDFVRNQSFRR